MFELLRFSYGGAAFGERLALANLDEAVSHARALMSSDERMSLVEVRRNGQAVFTVGRGWTSRKRPAAPEAPAR